jgi:hypothetical protein
MSSAEDSSADKGGAEDVWAEAVAEQGRELAAEAARLPHEPVPMDKAEPAGEKGARQTTGSEFPLGAELGPLVEEVRKFAAAVGEKVSAVGNGSSDPMELLQNLVAPLRSKSPAVYGHLLAAGGELIAAYRAAVSASERRWSAPKKNGSEHIDLD